MRVMEAAFGWLGLGKGKARAMQDSSRFNFSPSLIDDLKDDHGELLRMYQDIEQMARDGRFASVTAALAAFKTKFDVHVLHENLHFYCYLEEKLGGHAAEQALIKSFRAEMNSIARGVVNFTKKWRMSGVRIANGQEFLTELKQVGALLVQRVQREEQDLYTLYQP